MIFRRTLGLLALGFGLVFTSFQPAAAAPNNWTGATDALWDTLTNWSTSAKPISTDDVTFPTPVPATGSTITLGTGELANTLTFQDSYTLTGGDLTLTATTGSITVNPTFTATIASTLHGTALSKAGTGTLVLSGTSDFSGIFTVSAGVLSVQSAGALGQGGSVTATGTVVNSGAELDVVGGISLTGENLTLNGNGAGGGGSLVSIGNNTITTSIAGANSTIALNTASTIVSLNAGDLLTISSASTSNNSITSSTNANLTFAGAGNFLVSSRPISIGTGTMTMNGTGTLTLGASETTGAVSLNSGTIVVNSSGKINANLTVASGATFVISGGTDAFNNANTITLASGATWDYQASTEQISTLVGAGLLTRTTTGTGTITLNAASGTALFSGVIQNGAGTIAISKGGANTVEFTGTNTYTGTTLISTGLLLVDGPAGKISSTTITVGDANGADESFTIGNNADVISGTLDHIADNATVSINGSTPFTVNGPAAGSTGTNETIGTLALTLGRGTITLNPATGGSVQLSAGSLTRAANSTALIRGTNLGTTGVNSSQIFLTTVPTGTSFVGGSTTPGALNLNIIPWLVGDPSATGAGTDFVTYDATNGLRPLTAAEYGTTIGGNAGNNINAAGGETFDVAGSNFAINALKMSGGTTTIGDSSTAAGALTVTSGAILFTTNATLAGVAPVTFGSINGTITAAQNTTAIVGTISTTLEGSGGITFGSMGSAQNVILLTGNNRFTGGITINPGILRVGSTGALNNYIYNAITITTTSVMQLNGFNTVVGALTGGSGAGTVVENASATAATLRIQENAATTAPVLRDGTGAGVLSVVKTGGSALTFSANSNIFSGSLYVEQGVASVTSSAVLTGGTTGTNAIFVGGGGTLRLTNNSTNSTDRIRNTAVLTMRGGTFDFDNNAQASTNFSETIGSLTLQAGLNSVFSDQAASSQTSVMTFTTLSRSAGSVVTFSSQANGTTNNTLVGLDTRDRLVFSTAPTLNDGIIGGWAFGNVTTAAATNSADFATYLNNGVAAGSGGTGTTTASASVGYVGMTSTLSGATVPTYSTDVGEGTWTTTTNLLDSTVAYTLTADRTVNSMKMIGTTGSGGTAMDLGTHTLTVDTGGILYVSTNAAATTLTLSDGSLTATGGTVSPDLVIRMNNANDTLALSANLVDNGANSIGLTVSGPGAVTLSGTNTYSGGTAVVGGTLNIDGDARLGTAPATATAGALKLYGSVLNISATTTLNANRLIEIGDTTATINVLSGATLTYAGSITDVTPAGSTFPEVTNFAMTGAANLTLSALTVGGNFTMNGSIVSGVTGTSSPGTLALGGASNLVGGTMILGAEGGTMSATYGVSGGTFSVGTLDPSVSNLDIGFRATVTTAAALSKGTLDLTGNTNFVVRVNNLQLGVTTVATTSGSSNTQGILIIGKNSDIYANTQILISNSGNDANTGTTSSIAFGSGSNNVITPLVVVGGQKGNGKITMASGGTLTLSGKLPASTDLRVAYNNVAATGTISTGTVDLSAGTFIADLNNVILGYTSSANTSGGGGTSASPATLTISNSATNSVSAVLVNVGDHEGAGAVSGTATGQTFGALNFGGGLFTVQTNLTAGLLALNTTGAGTGSYAATGTVSLTGGTVNVLGKLVVGNVALNPVSTIPTGGNSKATGLVTISGSAVTVGGNVDLGDISMPSVALAYKSQGTLRVTSGSLTVGGNITRTIGANAFASQSFGFLEVAGGSLDMTNGTIFASQMAFRSGSVANVATGGVTLDADNSITNAVSTINGATGDALILRDVTANFNVALTGTTGGNVHYEAAGAGAGGTLNGGLDLGTVVRTFNVENSAPAAADLTVTGTITNTGGVTKSGTGTLVFSGNNNYGGATTLNASSGVLVINGNQSAATGAVTVNSASTLAGKGIVGGATTVSSGGVVAPGDPTAVATTGKLTFSNGLTLSAGAVANLEITGATFTSPNGFGGNLVGTPGYDAYVTANGSGIGNHDQIVVNGSPLIQTDTAKINVLPVNFTAAYGQIFNLLDWTTSFSPSSNLGTNFRNGSADSGNDLDLPDISSTGLVWDISHFATEGVIVVVPEPSRALLLLAGLLGLGLRRRRVRAD